MATPTEILKDGEAVAPSAGASVVVTGGGGFIGSHLAERLVARRATTSA